MERKSKNFHHKQTTPFRFDYLRIAAVAETPYAGTQTYHFVYRLQFRPVHVELHNLRLRLRLFSCEASLSPSLLLSLHSAYHLSNSMEQNHFRKLIVAQSVRNTPSPFYWTGKFITGARHQSLYWATLIQSTSPHLIHLSAVPILSSYSDLRPQVGLFPSGFQTLYALFISSIRACEWR